MARATHKTATSVHDFYANILAADPAEEIQLSKYAGKVLLIVNVACEWGLTKVQYEQLNQLHDEYHDQGLVIIGQPCNQFGKQEPKQGKELLDEIRNKWNAKFTLFERADVNGKDATELFLYLQKHKNCPGLLGFNAIKWNFTKFLIGKDGQPIKRWAPKDDPRKAEDDIKKALAK